MKNILAISASLMMLSACTVYPDGTAVVHSPPPTYIAPAPVYVSPSPVYISPPPPRYYYYRPLPRYNWYRGGYYHY